MLQHTDTIIIQICESGLEQNAIRVRWSRVHKLLANNVLAHVISHLCSYTKMLRLSNMHDSYNAAIVPWNLLLSLE